MSPVGVVPDSVPAMRPFYERTAMNTSIGVYAVLVRQVQIGRFQCTPAKQRWIAVAKWGRCALRRGGVRAYNGQGPAVSGGRLGIT